MLTENAILQAPVFLKPEFSDRVALVKFCPGLDPAVIKLVREKGFKGILLEGSGVRSRSKYCFNAIQNSY